MAQPHINEIQAVDPVLTNMLLAYMQDDGRFIASRLAPAVPVETDSGTYYSLDKKHFFLDEMEERAPGSPFPESGYGVSTATYKTVQFALSEAIPDENRRNSQLPMELESISVARLGQAALIRKERDLASTFFTTGVWGTDNSNATDWDDFAAGDPVKDIGVAKRTISVDTGQEADTLAVGYIVHDALKLHPDIIDRLKHVTVANGAALEGALASILEVQNYLVSKASYNTANEGQTFSGAAIIDDDALVCHVGGAVSMFSPSAIKNFVWDGGGGSGSIYRWRDGKNHRDLIQFKMQFDQKLVGSDLGYFFSDIV